MQVRVPSRVLMLLVRSGRLHRIASNGPTTLCTAAIRFSPCSSSMAARVAAQRRSLGATQLRARACIALSGKNGPRCARADLRMQLACARRARHEPTRATRVSCYEGREATSRQLYTDLIGATRLGMSARGMSSAPVPDMAASLPLRRWRQSRAIGQLVAAWCALAPDDTHVATPPPAPRLV